MATTPALVEREMELAQLGALIDRAAAGVGGAVVIEGPAGIGKSSLVRTGRCWGAERGLQVLAARGAELERQYPFGVVRQLLTPVLVQAAEHERDSLLTGVAWPAARILRLVADDAPDLPTLKSEADMQHGLYWLCSNLADRAPILLAVDDAQWADPPSLRWLAYLARRLEDLPLLLVLSIRTSEPQESLSVLAELRADPDTSTLRPQPLTDQAVADVVGRLWGERPHEGFVRACSKATGGNPFFLRVLTKAALDRGFLPTAEEVDRLERLVPNELAGAILARIQNLPSRPLEFAQCVAIIGDKGDLRHAAELAGLGKSEAARAADELVAADLLQPNPPLQFSHALVRRAVYAATPIFERRLAHRRAAALLHREGRPTEEVAAHLLEGESLGEGWAVEVLRRAAAAAEAEAAPETAISYLRRALSEPPWGESRAEVLRKLGSLEARVGDPQAVEHLTRALEETSDAYGKAQLAVTLSGELWMASRSEEAVDLLRRTLDSVADLERELRLSIEADFLAIALTLEPGRRLIAERLDRVSDEVSRGETPAERRALVFLTQESLVSNRPAHHVAQLARRALGDGRLLSEVTAESLAYYTVIDALTFAGEIGLATRALDQGLQAARARGSAAGFCHATLSRCVLHRERGAIRALEAEAQVGFDAARALRWTLYEPIFGAYLGEALVERGELDAAEELLGGIPSDSPAAFFLLGSRGRLHLSMGKNEQALEDLLASGRAQVDLGVLTPAMYPWRSPAALALARMGDRNEAGRLVAEELRLASAFGTARAIGVALHAGALVEPHWEKRIELLRRAEHTLKDSIASLELARARADLGAALRRANMRTEARGPLGLALDAAHSCGATALAHRCWSELSASGARPRRTARTGLDSLTPSELRVAQLASEGLTIREIAQAIFISRKTVEKHLGQIYSKLGVHSRKQLQTQMDEPSRKIGGGSGDGFSPTAEASEE